MPQRKDATHWLREYGHSIEDNDGGLVRMKHGNVYEKFVPTDGGFHFYRAENGEWVQRVHHIDVGPNGEHLPDYLWPEDFVAHVYRAAVDPEYHAKIVAEQSGS